jgi:multidrug efflux pump subunit AcrA (membrane-fusion protein)
MRTEVMKDLREIQGKEAELIERRVAAEDQLKRRDIRAPQSGVVHQLALHTVGGVINHEPIMLIVPVGDALVIEAKISPQTSTTCGWASKRSCASRTSTAHHAGVQGRGHPCWRRI